MSSERPEPVGDDTAWLRNLPPRWIRASIVLLATALYLPTLSFGFVYDDHWTILANGFLRCPEDLARLWQSAAAAEHIPDWHRPTSVLFDMASYQLLGVNTIAHHALSVLLHVGVCAAAWHYLEHLGVPTQTRAAAVVLFAVLGIHAEAVAVVSFREDLLAALLGLLALLQVQRAWTHGRGSGRTAMHLACAVVLQALACAAKYSAAALPLLWLMGTAMARRWWAPEGRLGLTFPAILIGAIALGLGTAIALLQPVWILGGIDPYAAEVPPHAAAWPRAQVLARSVQIFAAVLGQMVLPWGLSPEYIDRPALWTDAQTLASLGGLMVLFVGAWIVRRRAPLILFGLVGTALLWLPTSSLMAMPNMRADRFAYLPSLAMCVAMGCAAWQAGRPLARRFGALWQAAPLALWVVIQGSAVQAAARVYASDGRLWDTAVRRAPDSGRAHAILGELVISTLDEDRPDLAWTLERAHRLCDRALVLAPADALPHLCAARLAVFEKRWAEAEASFRWALDKTSARKDRVLTALASAILDTNTEPYAQDQAEARELIARAIREYPYSAEIALAAGRLEHRFGAPIAALPHYRRARKLRPERWDVVLWGVELALDLGHAPAAWALWTDHEKRLPRDDPRVEATGRRLWQATRLFPTPTTAPIALGDLTDDP